MKRIGKVLKWIGIVAAVAIAILLILNAYFVSTTGRRLERQLLAVRKAGDRSSSRTSLVNRFRRKRTRMSYFRRVTGDLDAIQKELLVMYPKVGYPPDTGKLSSADQEKLEKIFAAYPKVMPLLEQAANCPDYDPQLDVTLPPSRFLQPFMDRDDQTSFAVSRLAGPSRLAPVERTDRGCTRRASHVVAAGQSLASRADAHRLSDDRGMRTDGHVRSEPGHASRCSISQRARVARRRAGTAQHDGGLLLGDAELSEPSPNRQCGSFPGWVSGC